MKTIKITENLNKKTSELLAEIKAITPVYSHWDDKDLDKSVPIPKEQTTRYFLDSLEPDTETLGLSYNDCIEKGLPMMTLREYLLFVLAYHKEHGELPDKKGWTITSTLSVGDRVMGGGRNLGRFWLGWNDRDDRDARGGPRSAVTLNPSTPSKNPEAISTKPSETLSLEQMIGKVVMAGYTVTKNK